MPGLHLYNRAWLHASDDLTAPACCCGLSRLAWIVLCSLVLHSIHSLTTPQNDPDDVCDPHPVQLARERVILFCIIGLTVFCISFIIHLAVLALSLRGTIVEVEKRQSMPTLLKLYTVSAMCELALAIYGLWLLSWPDMTNTGLSPCDPSKTTSDVILIHVLITANWIELSIVLCCGSLALVLSSSVEITPSTFSVPAAPRRYYAWGGSDNEPNSTAILERDRDTDDNDEEEDIGRTEEEDYFPTGDDVIIPSAPPPATSTTVNETMNGNNTSSPHRVRSLTVFKESLGRTPEVWDRRLRRVANLVSCLTCGLFGSLNGSGGPEAFQQVAVVLAGWFKNLDLVPSDLVAALLLMRAEQREQEDVAVQALLQARAIGSSQHASSSRQRLTHVGRWMWSGTGASTRAWTMLHAQRVRASRDALLVSGALDSDAITFLNRARELAPFMLGMYGWLLYGYMHGMRGWTQLCCRHGQKRCCGTSSSAPSSREEHHRNTTTATTSASPAVADLNYLDLTDLERGRPSRLFVLGDEACCGANTTALLQNAGRSGAAQADVVYASFTSQSGKTVPYCVCVDHAKKRVVVAIRGTFSFNDAVVDLTMVPEPLKEYANTWGFADEIDCESAHAHSGILRIAAWMRADLQRQDVLHRLFRVSQRASPRVGEGGRHQHNPENVPRDDADDVLGERNRAFSVDLGSLPDCRGYDLVVTGHSLGGGVAAVLSLFLRPAFPFVTSTIFSPPGCVFDWKLANKSSEWISALFVGKDYTARMSWHSLFKLRGQILDTLRRAKTNKASTYVWALLGAGPNRLLYKTDRIPDSFQRREFEKRLDELVSSRRSTILDEVRLYMPGKIMHLVKDETRRATRCLFPGLTQHYVPVWLDDRSALDEILLSKNMALDHFPDVVDSTLQKVWEEYCEGNVMMSSSSMASAATTVVTPR